MKISEKNKKTMSKAFSLMLVLSMLFGMVMPLVRIEASAAAPSTHVDMPEIHSGAATVCAHNYVFDSETPAGCLTDGVVTYVCTICNDSYSNTITALGHNRVNSICTRCGDVDYSTVTCHNITTVGGPNYHLFNSGKTGNGNYYGYNYNYNESSYRNGGYDLYATQASSSLTTIQLGLPFTVSASTSELVRLSIYAFDVDEVGYSAHHERDYIYLVDETTNTSVKLDGYLSGQDWKWNNTEFTIDPSNFVVGHTYHFELNVTCTACSNSWVVYVRTVTLEYITAPDPEPEIEADLSASISSTGVVSANLTAFANIEDTYTLEYKAVCTSNNAQYGGTEYSVVIPTTTSTFTKTFQLESGAKRGTYEITVFIKDGEDNVIVTRRAYPSYGYSAVSYNSNGGSQTLPTDGTTYSNGDTVTVLFNYIPSRYDYNFLGWSTDRNATEPMYTENGTKTFTIGASDVTLYAVWEEIHYHTESDWIIDLEPTCTTEGIKHTECTECGEHIQEETIPPLGHSESDWIVDVAETCTTEGSKHIECTRCGEILETEVIPPHEHDEGDWINDPEVTCCTDGRRYTVCTECGVEMSSEVIPATGNHTESDWIIDLEPTCTVEGSKHKECTNSGNTLVTETIPPLGHSESDWITDSEPTCTTEGSKHTECTECGEHIQTEAIPVIPHEESDWIVDVAETCTTDGSKHKECTVCHTVLETETIPAPGHVESDWITDSEPTCTTEGSKHTECTVCGEHIQTEAIPVIPHEESDWIVDLEPTCTTEGIKHTECTECGEHIKEETIPVIPHVESDWIVDLEPTCTTEGIKHTECTECGEHIQEGTIPVVPHEESDWIIDVEETCTTDGSKHIECTVCHTVIKTETIPTPGHVESDWIVDVEATATSEGSKHKECIYCHMVMQTSVIPVCVQMEISNVGAAAGMNVTVTIEIKNNPGIVGAILTLHYDPALTLVGIQAGDAWSTLHLTEPGVYGTPCNLVWDGVAANTSDGDIVALTFRVPAEAAIDTVFNITATYENGNIINSNYDPVNVNIVAGSIRVLPLLGDVNDDGTVDIADVVTLRRYIAGGYNVEINFEQSDMNSDGVITVGDIIALRRYLLTLE